MAITTTTATTTTKKDMVVPVSNSIADDPTLNNNNNTTASTSSTSQTSCVTALENNNTDANFEFDSMEQALEDFRQGKFLVVMDDESRENEGDLIISAANITTEQMAWFIKVTR